LPTKILGRVTSCFALWEAAQMFFGFGFVVAGVVILKAVAKLDIKRMLI
jgi:hypothetical protein